jgi:hypothetical protein
VLRICAISRKNWLFVGSDQRGETAAICFSILVGAKRHRIEPLAYVSALLTALSSTQVDLESLLPDVWIAAHPEHLLTYRRDEAETAAAARRRRPGSSDPTNPVPLRATFNSGNKARIQPRDHGRLLSAVFLLQSPQRGLGVAGLARPVETRRQPLQHPVCFERTDLFQHGDRAQPPERFARRYRAQRGVLG